MKHRTIVLASAAGLVIVGLTGFGLSQASTLTESGLFGAGQEVILLDEATGFEAPATLQLPQMEGWHSKEAGTTMNNPGLRCRYMFDEDSAAGASLEHQSPEFSSAGDLLAQVKEDFAGALPGPEKMTEADNVVIQQKALSEPGLEFKVARIDYAIAGMTGTVRIAGRNLPQSSSALLVFLSCPTSVVDNGSDPWPELIAGTSVVTGGNPESSTE